MEALDEIANAVSEVLLVFEEAQSDFDTNIVVEAKNLDYLVNSIMQMVEDKKRIASQIEEDGLRNLMNQSNSEISNACQRLERLIRAQPNGIIGRSAYAPLHDELGVILRHMITQLKITEQVNVGIIMKTAKRNLDIVARMKNVDTVTGLVGIAREASKMGLDLQIQLKTKIAELTDANLKRRLSDGAEQVRTGTPIAISACQTALESPSSENNAKKDRALRVVLESLKEIVDVIQISAKLIGDYELAFAFPELTAKLKPTRPYDPSRTPRVNQELARLEDAVRRGDAPAAEVASRNLREEGAHQVQRARDAAKGMKDARGQQLNRDADALEKAIPAVIDLAQGALRKDPSAMQKFPGEVQRTREINNRIDDALKPEKAFLQTTRDLDRALKELQNALDRGDKDRAIALAKEIADKMMKEAALARALADQMKDPEKKKRALDAIEEFERLIPLLVQGVKDCLENPNDKEARKRLDDIIDRIKAANAKIAREILEDQLAQNNDLLKRKLGDLYDAVKRGDAKDAAELLKDITDLINRRIELGRELASQVKDPALRKQILDAVSDLERLLPELVLATQEALANPTPENMNRLAKVIGDIKDAADRITSLKRFADKDQDKGKGLSGSFLQMGSNIKDKDLTAEAIIDNGNALNNNIDRLKNAVRAGDAREAAAAARELAEQIQRQIELGRRLAAQCEDPVLKKKILDACDELEQLCPQIVQAVKDALMHPDDKEKQERLERLLERARAANKVIMDAAEQMRSGGKKINDIAANMRNKSNKIDRNYDFKGDSNKDALSLASEQIIKVAKAVRPVIPEQKELVDLVAAIGAEMEALSRAAQTKNKKDMIASARKIAAMVAKVQSLATEIAQKCTDPVLREQLLSICRVPKNFAVQLKILCAVKATSGEDDAAAEAQLLTCAKGVANSVISTCRCAESAAVSAK